MRLQDFYIAGTVLLCSILFAHGASGGNGQGGGPSGGSGGSNLRCHQCTGVSDPHYCSMVVQCNAGEECHTEKVIGDDNTVFFNSDCKPAKLCQLAAHGRRSELHVCEGCCNTDLCNTELCPSTKNGSQPGVQCYQCDQVDRPEDCSNRITCADGEQCIVQEYADDNMNIKYSLGCETEMRCKLLETQARRSTQICNKCCDTPGCNRHLCVNGSSTTTPSTAMTTPCTGTCCDDPTVDCKLANDSQNICALRTIAATNFCPKFCGFCSADGSTFPPPTGVTEDPCKDNPQMDCNNLNDTLQICSKPNNTATMMYCPKFCGLCTSACADLPNMDCQKSNDTQNICALRTIAATKYCPKFCGYCNADGSTNPPPSAAGPTEDPCKDNPDFDCATMNSTLGLCNNKDAPPTMLYCPKYCGICTPACTDLPGMDCQKSNDTQNICGLRTIGATKYCQKFCGYCNADGTTNPTPPPAPGTTQDPCRDSGDLDCQSLDTLVGLCSNKTAPPVVLYCPKFCKIC